MKKNRRTKIRRPRKPLFYTADPRTSELKFLDELKDRKPAPARPQANKPVMIHSLIAEYDTTQEEGTAPAAATGGQRTLPQSAKPRAALAAADGAALSESVLGHWSSKAEADCPATKPDKGSGRGGQGSAESEEAPRSSDRASALGSSNAASSSIVGQMASSPGVVSDAGGRSASASHAVAEGGAGERTNAGEQGGSERSGGSIPWSSGITVPEARLEKSSAARLAPGNQDVAAGDGPREGQAAARGELSSAVSAGYCSGVASFSIPDGVERIHVTIVLPSFFVGSVRGRRSSYALTAVSNQPDCQVFVSSKTETRATVAVQRSKRGGILTGELNWIAAQIAPIP